MDGWSAPLLLEELNRLFKLVSPMTAKSALLPLAHHAAMGAIAEAEHYHLFRSILRATAALPGLFLPVNLRYSANGQTYTESHIDGGVHMQLLAIPSFVFN